MGTATCLTSLLVAHHHVVRLPRALDATGSARRRDRVAVARRARVVRAPRVAPRATPRDSDAADADVPEGYSERGNLGKQYYEGFLKSSLGESDSVQTENRDTITASVKLGVQATGVLAFLTLGFMASNGLL